MADPAVSKFQEAENELFARYDLNTRSKYFELSEPRVRVRVIEAGEGDPVLLVHGGGGIAAQWAPLMAQLTGRRIYAVDRPGHGLSGPFNYRGSDFRAHAVSFLRGICDALELDTVPVIANSMGGLWTLWLAIERPERVSSMALLGCPAMLLDTSAPFPIRLMGVRGLNSLMWASRKPSLNMVKGIHKMMGHTSSDLDRLPDEFWQAAFRAGMLPHFKEAWLTLLERVVGPLGPRRGIPIREEELRQASQPTLFIWGENDAFGKPSVGQRAVEIMPDARIEVVPGGHLPWLDDPVAVGGKIQAWLSGTANRDSAMT